MKTYLNTLSLLLIATVTVLTFGTYTSDVLAKGYPDVDPPLAPLGPVP